MSRTVREALRSSLPSASSSSPQVILLPEVSFWDVKALVDAVYIGLAADAADASENGDIPQPNRDALSFLSLAPFITSWLAGRDVEYQVQDSPVLNASDIQTQGGPCGCVLCIETIVLS